MSRSTIRQWFQRWFRSRLRSRRSSRSLFRRLFLELLEDRWVPAPVTWISSTGGDWDTAANWSTNTVPTAADDASITFAGILVTHNTNAADAVHSVNSAASFSLSAGSLAISSTGQFTNAFTLTGASSATLAGSGTVTLSGPTTWSGGTMGGTGLTILQGTTSYSVGTSSDMLDTRTLNNLGTSTLTDAGLTFLNGATVNNQSGATWNIMNSSTFGAGVDFLTGPGSFNNLGTLTTSSASGSIDFSLDSFTNSGTITIQSGTLEMFPRPGGPTTLTDGSVINGPGNFQLANSATLTVTGNSTIGCGLFTLGNNTGSGFITLTGSGTTTVTSQFDWVAGAMSGTGETDLLGSTTISSNAVTLNTRTLKNFATVEDNENLALSNAAVIDNMAGATWLLVATNATVFSGTGTFNNAGMFNMSGAGTDSIAIPFNSSGTVHVTSGGLTVLGDGTESGTINIDSSTTMTFSAGSDTFTNGAVVTGAGTFAVTGETMTVTGSVTVGNANFTFDSSTLTGSGTVTVGSATTWNNATMSGTGVTNLQGATTISGNKALDTRTLNNFGTVNQNTGTLTLLNGAVINNDEATWNLASTTDGLRLFSGSGTFNNNQGTLSAASAVTIVLAVPVNNSGDINVQSGTLTLRSGGQSTGGIFDITGGATLDFGGGTYNIDITSFVQGAGNVTFSASTVTVAGAFTPTGAISILNGATANFTHTVNDTGSVTFTTLSLTSGGILTGDATVTVTGATTWTGATMSGNGITALQGATALSGSNDTLDVRTLNNFGVVSDSTSVFLNNGDIDNDPGAVWNLQSNAGFSGSGLFANLGTLNAGGATNTIALPFFDNIGVVNVQSGALTVLGDGVDSGLFTIAGSASMTFSAGSDTFTAGALVNGAGTFVVSGSETLTVTGNVTFGSANFLFDTSTLTGPGTLTVTSATTWNNATMSGSGVTNLLGNTTIGSGTSGTLSGRTLNNAATVTVLGGLLDFGAVINNQSGAVWDLQNNASFGGQNDTFNNAGTLQMSSGTASDFDATLNSRGLVDGRSGTLDLLGGGTETGTFTAENGTTLEFGGGTYNFNAGSAVTGAGSLLFSFGTVANIAGGFTSTGLVSLVNGTANFTNTVNGSGSATITSLSIGMGTLTGAATITVTGATSWDTGTMSGGGVTNFQGGLSLGGNDTVDARTLNNFGTTTDFANLALVNGVVVNNQSGATWNLQGFTSTSSGVFNNLGTLQSTGTDSFTVTLNNSGTFNVQSSTITGNSVVSNSGTVTLVGGSTLAVTSFTQTAGKLAGGGVLQVVNGAVINGGIVSPGSSPGILDIQGNYTQNGNSALNIEIDGPTAVSQYSVLAVSGTATLGGTLNIERTTGFVATSGQTFQILTASGVSGTFATINGLQINGSESFTVTYNATNVVLGVGTQRSLPPDQLGIVTPAADGTATWTLYNDFIGTSAVTTFTFGLATDIPLVGDWNGSGFDSVGVVRPTAGGVAQWSLDTNGDHAFDAGDSVDLFGLNTDIPVVGDWNGSGTTKIGTVRDLPDGAAQWSLDSNGNGTFDNSDEVMVYGLATDQFGAGHWTGPGKDELAVVRPGPGGTAQWILNTTGTGVYSPSDTIYTFGYATDTFIVGDWNGDGRTKIGVERPGPNGTAVFTLDTNGDGVYDAGDQVIIIPASAAGTFEFGNWKRLAGLTVTDPPNALVPPLPLDATFQADMNLAINEWAQAGLNGTGLAQLRALTYSVSTLGGGTTALTDGNHIVLDATAAGNGWSEGATPQPGQIDLVTALAHEMGHALGLGHSPDPNDVMFATLPTGVRRAPTTADVNALGMQ